MRLIICGDFSRRKDEKDFSIERIGEIFNDVTDIIKDSDRAIVNVECALTERDEPIKKIGPNLKASPCSAEVLKAAGFTDCTLSNNHIMDFGIKGAEDTIKALSDNGLSYTGFGADYEDSRKNLVISKDGKTVTVINVCEHEYCYALNNRMGTRPFDVFDTIHDIRQAKKESDYVIVIYHGGKEQSVYPSPRLRKTCKAMADNGADVILCQHSHCIGCYEMYNGAHILYGQGNFCFTATTDVHPHWKTGLIVRLDIAEKAEIKFIPVNTVGSGIELSKGSMYDETMATLKKQSENLHNGKWLEGWKDFCREYAGGYISAVKNAYSDAADEKDNELFAHHMRCEAHHDVWDEIFKLSWETRKRP